jgi:serine/threonine protein kinase/tetratricopeptide (TPR) repeat protein
MQSDSDLPVAFGKYELLERIATGGMAEVFLARSFGVAGFEKRLVLKRLRPELAEDPRFVSMFIAEAKLGVHLNHPNIVQVYELGRVGSTHYIAMEHLHGRDLTRLLRTLRARGERVPPGLAVAIMAQVCRGLAYAHGRTSTDGAALGLVHRDVSPHNVIVTFAGEVKLVDFGIARLMHAVVPEGERKPGPGAGKYAYMSPEQVDGGESDHRSDLYSTGIVLWELLVGRRLYQDPDPAEKLRRVKEAVIPSPASLGVPCDDALWQILRKVLARDPGERHQSATHLEDDLRGWLFEHRERVGRPEIAELLRREFPDDAARSEEGVRLDALVADVARLDPVDATPSDTPSTRGRALPGHLVSPAGEVRPVVAVMIDIDGLTELSARVDPERLVARKFGLLRAIRRIVDRHGGHLQRTVDDHVTVLFGVPRTRPDDVEHAVEFALDLQHNVDSLRREGMNIQLAIGVHSGEVTVSRGGRRVRYVARADTTRLARRLSAVADHGQILLSERIFASVEGSYRVRPGPGVSSRSGRPDTRSFLLQGRARTLRGGGVGTWMRRDRELDVLRLGLAGLASGRGATLRLSGEVGTGKSRFIREIRELSVRRGTAFYGVRCTAFGTERALEPLRDLLCQVLGVDAEAAPAELLVAVDRLQQVGLGPRDLEVISKLFGGGGAIRVEESEVWQAAAAVLRGLATDRPMLVAFDDVHNLTEAHCRELVTLVNSLADMPVLFLLAHHAALRLPGVGQELLLHNFEPARLDRVVESWLGVSKVDPALVELLARTCEGNPRYVEEMLKILVERGQLQVSKGAATLSGELTTPLPHSLQALITARIDALDPTSRGLLQLAAVIGPTFSRSVLAEAAGLPDPTPLLLDLSNHGLLARDPGPAEEWTFTSDLVQEAALRGILGVQRRDYHRLVSRAYELVFAERLDPYLETLTAHCAEGGRPLDAARYAHRAGQQLEQEHFFDRARRAYRLGLEQVRLATGPDGYDARVQGEAMLEYRLGSVELLLGNARDGHHHLRLALDISSDAGLPWIEARVHTALGRSFLQEGRPALAQAHVGQALDLLRRDPDPAVEREAVETAALVSFEAGNNDEAERLWHRAMTLAVDEPAAVARCRIGLANRYLRMGDGDRALQTLEVALATARTAGDRILEGRVLNNIGLVHAWARRTDDALRCYRQALELREGLGYTRGVVVNHHNIGDVWFQANDFVRARLAFQRSRELAASIGWARGVALNDVFLAYLDQRGQEPILEATARAVELGDVEIAVTGWWLAGRLALEAGSAQDARPPLLRALEAATRLGLSPMIELVQGTLAAIAPPGVDPELVAP